MLVTYTLLILTCSCLTRAELVNLTIGDLTRAELVNLTIGDLTRAELVNLTIGSLLPFTGVWPGGAAMLASAELALETINNNPNILEGYNLKLEHRDSQFKVYEGTQMLHELLTTPPVKLMIMGEANSELSESCALVSELWNLVCISYASVSPVLSDKKTFPRFFRTSAPDTAVNPARVNLMRQFNWRKAALLHQSRAVFDAVSDDFKKKFHDNNLTLMADEVFQYDPAPQVEALKKRDARIIFTISNVDKALMIFCEAYHRGMYGAKYVWFVVGWYDDKWWLNQDQSFNCTQDQMRMVAEGHMAIGDVTLNPSIEPGISGINSATWTKLFDEKTNYTKPHATNLAPQSFDAIWAMALALHETETQLISAGSGKRLSNFTYADREISDIIYRNLQTVTFDGVKSPIVFDQNQDPIIMTKISRVQEGTREVVGIYFPGGDDGSRIEWSPDTPLIWKGRDGRPPVDSTTFVEKTVFVSIPVYAAFCVLAGLGIIQALIFLVINIKERQTRIIKMSSPNINNLILLGCIFMYVSVFLQELESSAVQTFCRARNFLQVTGFALAFGALFSKTWRIHIIFANKQMKRKVVKDWELGILVGVLLLMDLTVLVVWEVIDPQKVAILKLREQEIGDSVIVYYLEKCSTTYRIYFLGTLYIIQGLLLVFGAFLAFETRKVTIPALNDSHQIGMCIYNVMILSLMSVIMSFVLGEQIQLSYSLISGFIIIGTTMTQCLIFVPKLLKLKDSKISGEDGSASGTTTTTTFQSQTQPTLVSVAEQAGKSADDSNQQEFARKLGEAERLLLEKEQLIQELQSKLRKSAA